MIQAVFFDAFGTLCEIQEKLNPYKPILKAWPAGLSAAYQAVMTHDSSPAQLARQAGCTPEVIHGIEHDIAMEIASIRLYPEVSAVLETIKHRGLKWAIVSNLATPYAAPLLMLLPFAPDACAWSFAVGYRKPEEAIYLYACDALGVAPASVLMVGDSLKNDYNTPKRLGMQARYLKRSGIHDAMPKSIADLTGVLSVS